MPTIRHIQRSLGGVGAIALILASVPAAPLAAAATRVQPSETMTLSIGRGQLINLSGAMTDLFVANPAVADVQVRSKNQLYVFGKGEGETNVYATSKTGAVIWSTTVRVGSNLNSVGEMLKIAMPDADIKATPMNGLVLLTGTVRSPGDIEEAQRLTQAYAGDKVQVVSRLKSAVPQQVNLQVRIAEVSRNVLKNVGFNLLSGDQTGGFKFGLTQGRGFSPQFNPGGALGTGVTAGAAGTTVITRNAPATTLGFAGNLLGVDLLGALDLAEQDGLVSTLASPNLTALSGETASFLAGGEIPIPISQGFGSVSVEYKQYGVSLAFTPTVLSDSRITMRVRPEVSQLDDSSAVTVNGFSVPGLTTRRAETTVELGSGQSFVIGGLLSNTHNNSISKAPFLGDLPVLGALFRSNGFRHQQTELVIVVTPYLVNPTSTDKIALPTDGYHGADDLSRIVGGQLYKGKSGEQRPMPRASVPATLPVPEAPATVTGAAAPSAPAPAAPPAPAVATLPAPTTTAQRSPAAAPGFSFN